MNIKSCKKLETIQPTVSKNTSITSTKAKIEEVEEKRAEPPRVITFLNWI